MLSVRAMRQTACCAAAVFGFVLAPHPASAYDNPLAVTLQGTSSRLRTAGATIFGTGAGVLVDVTRYREVAEGAAVTLNTGSCSHPGDIAYRLAPFAKYGSVTQLPQLLPQVAKRVRSLVIHQNADDGSPAFACGNVTG